MNKISLKVEIQRIKDLAIIRLASNFFTSSTMAKQLKYELDNLFNDGTVHIIVNMRNVTSIDSEGLGVLTYGYKKCTQKNGCMILCEVENDDVMEVLEIVNLSKIIKVFPTETEALENIKII